MSHEFLLIAIMIGVGILAGITNFIYYYFKENTKPYEITKYLLSGIGAALFVPLVLNMLSSDLIRKSDTSYSNLNCFIFAGFCFIAGYFSDRFINSVGEKILKDIEKTNAKVDTAIKATKKMEEKVDIITSGETEDEEELNNTIENFTPRELFKDEDMQEQLAKILKSFSNPNLNLGPIPGLRKN